MSRVTLVAVNPRNPATGVIEELLWCHNARTRARFLGFEWKPQIVSLPDSEMDLGFDGAKFGQAATPQIGQLRVAISRTDSWAGLAWKGAFGSLRSAPWPAGPDDPADAAFAIDLLFRVESLSIEDGVATFTLIDLGTELRRPLISRKFGSTGNALLDGAGAVDMRGRVVPTGWGRLRSVPGILVDRVNNVWLMLDRPSTSIQGFFDGGAAFTMGVSRASLAALQATSPAAGAVDYCLDAGGLTLARPWTDPTYPFTADLTAAGPLTAGDIALAVIDLRSGIDVGDGIASAFNALYPAPCGLYVNDERTAATAVDELIVRLGGYWRITGTGAIALGRLAPAAPIKTFGPSEVSSISRQSIVMPTRRRAVGYARNNRVHNEGEIASILLVDDIAGLGDLATQNEVDFATQVGGAAKPADNATRNVDRGAWVSAALGTAYVVGDEVQDQGSTWGCILTHSKTALNGPPTLPTASNTTWRLRSAKGDIGNTGADGAGTLPIYRRSATQPATPSPSSGVPSGWYSSTGDVPAGSEPMWVAIGTRPNTTTNWTWPAATRHEAISAVNTGDSTALGFTTSAVLTFTLAAGESRIVRGQLALEAPTGAGDAYVQLESRQSGGGWSASNGTTQPYAVGEPAFPVHQITVTNSTGRLATFEVRGTGVRSNANSGPATAGTSVLSV